MIGRQLGDYRVLAKIGRGGMGSVYLASDRQGQRVALKVLDEQPDGPVRSDGLRRFAAELEALRRIENARIVRALGPVQFAAGHHFFPMEYVRGRNLAQVLAEVGRLEPGEALHIAEETLEGLEAAHAAGVLHRDVKSANLLIGGDGHVKVCDFGLARAMDQTRLTLSGQMLGTPAYVSPEQGQGHDARVESDVYSLGVVLYEALTGTLPFRAETPLALLRMHIDDEPDPPSSRRPGLAPEFDALVLRAMAKDPEARFPSAAAMRKAVAGLRKSGGHADSTRLLTAVRELALAETIALEERIRKSRAPGPRRVAALAVLALCGAAAWTQSPAGGSSPPPPAHVPPAVEQPDRATPEPARTDATLLLEGGGEVVGELVAIEDGAVRLRRANGQVTEVPLATVREIRYGR